MSRDQGTGTKPFGEASDVFGHVRRRDDQVLLSDSRQRIANLERVEGGNPIFFYSGETAYLVFAAGVSTQTFDEYEIACYSPNPYVDFDAADGYKPRINGQGVYAINVAATVGDLGSMPDDVLVDIIIPTTMGGIQHINIVDGFKHDYAGHHAGYGGFGFQARWIVTVYPDEVADECPFNVDATLTMNVPGGTRRGLIGTTVHRLGDAPGLLADVIFRP